jgi:hypothetical protein
VNHGNIILSQCDMLLSSAKLHSKSPLQKYQRLIGSYLLQLDSMVCRMHSSSTAAAVVFKYRHVILLTYLLTYSLHGAGYYLTS